MKSNSAESGVQVTESKMLKHNITKDEVEVDVCLEQGVAGHSVIISLECTSTKRPATREWVERMHGKHLHLPTHKLILASRRGFSKKAKEEARIRNIETLELSDFTPRGAKSLVDSVRDLWFRTFSLTAKSMSIIVGRGVMSPEERIQVGPEFLIYNEHGIELETAQQLAHRILKSERVGLDILSRGNKTHKGFDLFIPNINTLLGEKGLYLKCADNDELRLIMSIRIVGEVSSYIPDKPL